MTDTVLDQTQDLSGAELHRLTSLFPPPAFVKQASHDQLCGDTEELPPHVFAYPGKRLYRFHTKAATWMSALFYGAKRQIIPEPAREIIQANLLKAAGAHGILSDVAELLQKMAAPITDAGLPDSVFALVWTDTQGNTQRKYSLRNPAEIEKAAAWFVANRDAFTYPDRRVIATKILERSDELHVPLADAEVLSKTAGYGTATTEQVVLAWRRRAQLTHKTAPDFSKQAEKIATVIAQDGNVRGDGELLERMADQLDQFDRATRLTREYGKGLDRPEDCLFQVTQKVARDFVGEHVQLLTGRVYRKQALAPITAADLRDWLGDSVASQALAADGTVDIEKLAEVASVLPRPDAVAFDGMADARNIAPVGFDKAAATRVGFEPAELEALRQVYHQELAGAPGR